MSSAYFLPFYLFTLLPFQILLYVPLNLLEFRRELVEGVLLHHHFHLAQTVLIACHLGACLLGMNRPITDFILPYIAQGIADRLHQRANHQIEKMMTLYIQIGVMLVYPQIVQVLNHIRQLILERLEAALQLEKLRPHLLGKIIDSLLRVLDSD